MEWSVPAPPAWALRGWTGRAADVAPRPSSSRQLHAGEALDWWRVEHVDRPAGLAEARSLPGVLQVGLDDLAKKAKRSNRGDLHRNVFDYLVRRWRCACCGEQVDAPQVTTHENP